MAERFGYVLDGYPKMPEAACCRVPQIVKAEIQDGIALAGGSLADSRLERPAIPVLRVYGTGAVGVGKDPPESETAREST